MRPVEEQTILVTGATDGLGRETARELASRGATVLVHGRDRKKGEATLRDLNESTGSDRFRLYVADLSSLAQVRRLAEAVGEREERLDVLVNNAGIVAPERRESEDGYELGFAVNYLSGFLLTNLLLPLLERSAPARVVNVASIGQAPIDFDDPMLEQGFDPYRSYAQSKLAQVMFTFELAERLGGGSGVTVNALHPATLMDTKMVRTFGPSQTSVEEGVEATVHLILGDDLEGVSGAYYDRLHEARASEQAYDPEARRRLWELSEHLTG